MHKTFKALLFGFLRISTQLFSITLKIAFVTYTISIRRTWNELVYCDKYLKSRHSCDTNMIIWHMKYTKHVFVLLALPYINFQCHNGLSLSGILLWIKKQIYGPEMCIIWFCIRLSSCILFNIYHIHRSVNKSLVMYDNPYI